MNQASGPELALMHSVRAHLNKYGLLEGVCVNSRAVSQVCIL